MQMGCNVLLAFYEAKTIFGKNLYYNYICTGEKSFTISCPDFEDPSSLTAINSLNEY